MTQITLTGEINQKGNYGFYNMNQFAALCKKYPNHKIIMKGQIEMSKSKNALLAVYNIETIPMVQKALYKQGDLKNTRQTNEYLLNLCPLTQEKALSELNYDELLMFMDYVNNYSLEHLNVALVEPRTL